MSYSYLINGQHHTDTSTGYCQGLGMTDEQIESLQQSEADYTARCWQKIREKRDQKLRDVEWRLHRMYREDMLGLTRTDSEDTILEIHQYMQDLADVPNKASDPDKVVWPILEV